MTASTEPNWGWWSAWCALHYPDARTDEQRLAQLLLAYQRVLAGQGDGI